MTDRFEDEIRGQGGTRPRVNRSQSRPLINSAGDIVVPDPDSGERERLLLSGFRPVDSDINDDLAEVAVQTGDQDPERRWVRESEYAELAATASSMTADGTAPIVLADGNREVREVLSDVDYRRHEDELRTKLEDYGEFAFLEGLGRTLSFGLGPKIREYLAPGSEALSENLIAHNQTEFGFGVATGIVGSLLTPGAGITSIRGLSGMNVARSLATGRGLGVAGIGGASRTMGQIAQGMIVGRMAPALGMGARSTRVAGVIGREATEALAMSAGANAIIADATNTPWSAEKVLADAGIGAALGLGLRGALSTARMASTAGRRLINEGRLGRLAAFRQSPRLSDAARKVVSETDEVLANHSTRLGRLMREGDGYFQALRASMDDYANLPITRSLDEMNQSAAWQAGNTATNQAGAVLRGALTRGEFASAKGAINQAIKAVDDIGMKAAPANARAVHSRLFSLRGALTKIQSANPGAARPVIDQARRSLTAALQDDAFGAAGQAIRARDALVDAEIALGNAKSSFGGSFAANAIRRSITDASNPMAEELVQGVARNLDEVREAVKRADDLLQSSESGAALASLDNSINEMARHRGIIATRAEAVRSGQKPSSIAAFLNDSSASAFLGAAVGGHEGGLQGAMMGALMGKALNPARGLGRLVSFAKVLGRTETRIGRANAILWNKLKSGSRTISTVGEAGRRSLPASVALLRSPEDRDEAYRNLSQELRELAANPQQMLDRLSVSGEALAEFSPEMAEDLAMQGVAGAQYLIAHMPSVPEDPMMPGTDMFLPSVTEMDAFIDRFLALEDPISVYEDAMEGLASFEAAEAVRSVYPNLFEAMRTNISIILSEHTSNGGSVSLQQRLQLGTLYGQDMDPNLAPDFINRLQSHAAQTTEQAQANGLTGPRPASRPLGAGSAATTQAQRISEL